MLRNLLEKSRHVLVVSHVQPDGDAIGSLLAMGFGLEARGKQVVLYNEDALPASFDFLPGIRRITRDPGPLQNMDTLIVLDSGDADRMGRLASELEKIPQRINIDHHPSNTNFGTFNLVDPGAASTTAIIYRIFREMGWEIPLEAAWGIYAGIFTDTGGFRFSNTSTEALTMAAEMTTLGVHPETVARNIYGKYAFSHIQLLQRALASIKLAANGQLATMVLTRAMLAESGASDEEASGLVNYARNIEGVEMAALIREKEDTSEGAPSYKVSLRTNGRMDATVIAMAHGGGGHKAAAGFSTTMNLPDILTLLENSLSQIAPRSLQA